MINFRKQTLVDAIDAGHVLVGITGTSDFQLIDENGVVLFSTTGISNDVSALEALTILNFVGTTGEWDADTNTPDAVATLTANGQAMRVSVAGTTNVNGISTWVADDYIYVLNGQIRRLGGGADHTALDIKTLYESNADTNALVDSEKEELQHGYRLVTYNASPELVSNGGETFADLDVSAGGTNNDYELPTAASNRRIVKVRHLAGTEQIRILPEGSDLIDGETELLLSKDQVVLFERRATGWVATLLVGNSDSQAFMSRITTVIASDFQFPQITDVTAPNANGDTDVDWASNNNGSPFTLIAGTANDPEGFYTVNAGNLEINANGEFSLSYSSIADRDDSTGSGSRTTPIMRLQESTDGIVWTNINGTESAGYTRANNSSVQSVGGTGAHKTSALNNTFLYVVTGLSAGQKRYVRVVGFQLGGTAIQTSTLALSFSFNFSAIKIDNLTVVISDFANLSYATEAQARNGVVQGVGMDPLRVAQAIESLQDYKAGIDNARDINIGIGFFQSDFFTTSLADPEWHQATFSSNQGVRLLLAADLLNDDESDTARIVFQGDGTDIKGIIGNTGTTGLGADGELFDGAGSNDFCIHVPSSDELSIGVQNKVYMRLDSTGNGELILLGEGVFDSGFFLRFGDLDMGICEFTDDDLRVHATADLELSTINGAVKIGNSLAGNTPTSMSSADTVATFNASVGLVTLGTHSVGGLLRVSNQQNPGVSDIWTDSNTVVRISNSGIGNTGASLQLKASVENYLFSFEGHGGFRYWSRTSSSEVFRVDNTGSITVQGAVKKKLISTAANNYAVLSTDYTIVVDAVASTKVVDLPPASAIVGRMLVIKKIDATANTITVDANSAELIDGVATAVLSAQNETITLQSDGVGWITI